MNKYNLYRLGWKNFEDLCGHIMQNVLGSTYTPFAEGKDGGRDGFFQGKGNPKNKELPLSGRFVFQCKFTSKENNSITKMDLQQEVHKVKLLVDKNEIDHYIVFTNYKLTAGNDLEIRKMFEGIKGLSSCSVLGNEWIELTLDKNKSLRKLVPRLYGIGDLSEILDERVYQQSLDVVEELKENVSSFVITKSYNKAINAINNKRFVMLLGQPASGKTAIATNIAMTSIIEDQLTDTLVLETPNQFRNHWNPHNPNQLFWFDDVFGATNLDYSLVDEWEKTFPKLRAAVKKGAKVIFTSRDYIFEEAKNKLKGNSFFLLYDSQVVIDVEKLNLNEKRQILYNHIKSGDLKNSTKSSLKPYLNDIFHNTDFTPELARRLGSKFFHKDLRINKKKLKEFVSNPSDFFEGVINNLAEDKKAAMILILIHNNQLISPVRQDHLDKYFVDAFNVTLSAVKDALENMKNSLVKLNVASKQKYWSLYHPSMLDSLHIILSKREEMLELYILTVDINTLIRDTTFREESNKIFIPSNLWKEATKRILTFAKQGAIYHDKITGYLLNEATDDYLKWLWQYEQNILEILTRPSFHQLIYISTYKFVFWLKKLNLVKENWILSLRITIYNIAIEECDLSFLKDKFIMEIIDNSTIEDIISELISEGINYFYDIFEDIKLNLEDELEPDEVEEEFDSLLYTAEYLVDILEKNEYEYNADSFRDLIETVNDEIDDIKKEHSDISNDTNNSDVFYKSLVHGTSDDIFSDVDE